MEVFKFGGASINSSVEVENMASIVHYNHKLTLFTIKNFNQIAIESYVPRAGVLLEQKSRADIQLIYQQE